MIERRVTESWEDVADRRIRQAQADGLFDKLPGFGQPIPGIDDPPDENWWLKQKLRDEQFSALPPILQARLDRAKFLESLDQQIRASHFSGSEVPWTS